MIYKEAKLLSVIDCEEERLFIKKEELASIINKFHHNAVYFTCQSKLYGVVSSGDIIGIEGDCVKVNKKFRFVKKNYQMEARILFKENEKITYIPVVDEDGLFLGAYHRDDESLFLEDYFENLLKSIEWIPAVKIAAFKLEKSYNYLDKLCIALEERGVSVDYYKDFSTFFDRDYTYYLFEDLESKWAAGSYFSIIKNQNFYNKKRFSIREFLDDCRHKVHTISLINAIRNCGIKVCVVGSDSIGHNYCKSLEHEMIQRNERLRKENGVDTQHIQLEHGFFAEYGTNEYVEALIKLGEGWRSARIRDDVIYQKKLSSEYWNVSDSGERMTVGQPEEYEKSIYMVGPCVFVGSMCEDRHTIASFLQEIYNNKGIKIRVVNYGAPDDDISRLNRLIRLVQDECQMGDTIIVYFDNLCKERLDFNIADCIEKERPPVDYFTDKLVHCNFKINKMIANGILEVVGGEYINNSDKCRRIYKSELPDEGFLIKCYVRDCFSDLRVDNKRIGSIVMNCNPFTLGHRYLIEKASKDCDFLIVFVVEEDKSDFSFSERFMLVKRGVFDLKNVYVVPSGQFILSKTTFPEYFIKIEDEDIDNNVDTDVEIFGKYISKYLNIKRRYVGEELFDPVTNRYNQSMKKILPQYGVELIEEKRCEGFNGIISATRIREAIGEWDWNYLKENLPYTSYEYIKQNEL